MKPNPRRLAATAVFSLAWGTVACLAPACSKQQAAADSVASLGTTASPEGATPSGSAATPAADSSEHAVDASTTELAPFQGELLELAYQTATKIPVKPHIKTRCRSQEAVVDACLELGQPERAEQYLGKIGNWRQGAAWADLAYYLAQHGGDRARIAACLERADGVAKAEASAEDAQAWRPDRIRAKIARTHLALGEDYLATELQAGIVDSERGLVDAERARGLEPGDVALELEALDAAAATGNLEVLQGRLAAAAALFDRFYDDADLRRKVEDQMKAAWSRIPMMIRVDLLVAMVDAAVRHGDDAEALNLVGEGRSLVDETSLTAEYSVPLRARLAELRFRAGAEKEAREEAKAVAGIFDAQVETIVDIFRAEALTPLAVAYQAMGDPAAALTVYRRAVEEAVHNVNSVPRAEDLVDLCVSMAVHGVEPDAGLRARLREVTGSLSDPW